MCFHVFKFFYLVNFHKHNLCVHLGVKVIKIKNAHYIYVKVKLRKITKVYVRNYLTFSEGINDVDT